MASHPKRDLTLKEILENISAELRDTVNRFEVTTESLASSQNRLLIELQKNQQILEKYNLPAEKIKLVLHAVQYMLDTCTRMGKLIDMTTDERDEIRHELIRRVGIEEIDKDASFEEFEQIVTARMQQMERELSKMNAFREMLSEMEAEK